MASDLEQLTKRELISLIYLEVDRVEKLTTQLAGREEAVAAFRAFVRADDRMMTQRGDDRPWWEYPAKDREAREYASKRAAVERWMEASE